ncbi:MAG TPA: UbiA family prenyltransferase [Polyangiaceae bacterium]|nr:UbiA family prenyltransferase [Polyangiaceae bacterium]
MLRPLLRLARIPNVFTACANVVAGVALVRAGEFEARDVLLVGASAALYTAGMVLNDYFDRNIDAIERPTRPIPAGEVSARTAALLGGVLLVIGVSLAAAHGLAPLLAALGVLASVLLYDAALKSTALGPLAMGSCRAFNLGLGLSVARWSTPWLIVPPLVLGAFTLLITQLSRFEVGGTGASRLRGAVLSIFALGLALLPLLACVSFATGNGAQGLAFAALPLGYVLIRGYGLYAPLRANATPPIIGRAIGGGILLMPAVDSAFVAAAGAPLAAAIVFAFAGPAHLLKRWYYLT